MEKKTGVPFRLFDRLTGLAPNDAFVAFLAKMSGKPVPNKLRRQRSQLLDAMLDGHFSFGGKKIAMGAQPSAVRRVELARGNGLYRRGGCHDHAVARPRKMPADEVLIGDLEDLENRAGGCDLIVTHSHGQQMSERLGIPLFRYGLPTFDRLGAAHRLSVGYRGTRDLIFDIGNMFMAEARSRRRTIGGYHAGKPMMVRRLRPLAGPGKERTMKRKGLAA